MPTPLRGRIVAISGVSLTKPVLMTAAILIKYAARPAATCCYTHDVGTLGKIAAEVYDRGHNRE